jgi:hypothetical protein
MDRLDDWINEAGALRGSEAFDLNAYPWLTFRAELFLSQLPAISVELFFAGVGATGFEPVTSTV